MSFGKAIGTVALCLLLLFASAVALATGLLTFVVMNPAYYRAAVPTKAYCAELRERIGENLDHIAIQYGIEEGSLNDIVTDEDIRAYAAALTDALFDENTTDSIALPAYPTDAFAGYLRAHTAYSDQAIRDFSEDCAASVTEDFGAVGVGLLVGTVVKLQSSRLALLTPILFIASAALTVILIAMAATVFAEQRGVRGVVIWGGLFLGTATLFVPIMEFWLFDFVGRLNISASAFRTILTGFLNAALYGSMAITGALLLCTFVALWISCARAKRKNRR